MPIHRILFLLIWLAACKATPNLATNSSSTTREQQSSATRGQLHGNSSSPGLQQFYSQTPQRRDQDNALSNRHQQRQDLLVLNTMTFSYTGSFQTFVVPGGVTSLTADVSGAQGGTDGTYGVGGYGGQISGVIPVAPGETLNIYIGGQGALFNAGFNGGGISSSSTGGGGATDIRRSPYALSDRLIVAGGGGGGYNSCRAKGGSGAYSSGGVGQSGTTCGSGTAGMPGTQSGGGVYQAAACSFNVMYSGSFGQGGSGCSSSGGAGGGGWYGGAGNGGQGGGGGGSSYVAGTVMLTSYTGPDSVGNTGHGKMTLTFDVTASPTLAPTSPPSQPPTCIPTAEPTSAPPTRQPTVQPTSQPSSRPTQQPTTVPTNQPSALPTSQPSSFPSCQPTVQPSAQPSPQPSSAPTQEPTAQPSSRPSRQPSAMPTQQPISGPSAQPSQQPSSAPTQEPTAQPSAQPSQLPKSAPTQQPTTQPSSQPSFLPKSAPTRQPTTQPSSQPSLQPKSAPTRQPSAQPSSQPSQQPRSPPTSQPSNTPTQQPSAQPNARPSSGPSSQPTGVPSCQPSAVPTGTNYSVSLFACNITHVASARTTAELRLAISGAQESMVYVTALPAYRPLSLADVAAMFTSPFSVLVKARRSASLNITGLAPDTALDLYCAAANTQGDAMSLSSVLSTRRSLHTACCKTLTVTVLHPARMYPGSSSQHAVTVSPDTSPAAAVTVTLEYVRVDGGAANGAMLFPAALRVDTTAQPGSRQNVQLTALVPGEYTLFANVSGLTTHEYAITYVGSRNLTVLSPDATPAGPQLLRAVFGGDGSYVTLSFDSATDRGGLYGTFPCRALLQFVGDRNARCEWFSDNLLRVYPVATTEEESRKGLNVNSNITLLALKVHAQCVVPGDARCELYDPIPTNLVYVAAPASTIAPKVYIAAPAAFAACGSLVVDMSGSDGAGGRPWSRVQFTVTTSPFSREKAMRVQLFLSRNYTISPPTPVPSSELTPGHVYTIKATLCNFLGSCGTGVKAIAVLSPTADSAPLVHFPGQSIRSVYRTNPWSIAAIATVPPCPGNPLAARLMYSWSSVAVTDGESTPQNVTVRSTSQDPAVFKVSAYTLSVGATYTITATVRSSISSTQSRAIVQVTVLQSDLVAVLTGGSHRYITVGELVTLDASSSYDKDYPGLALSPSEVSCRWICVTLMPVASPSCAVAVAPNPSNDFAVEITAPLAALNSTSQISVVVSDGARTSTAQVLVTVVDTPRPRLQINSDGTAAGKTLVLLGSLYLSEPCAAHWSVNDPTIQLSAVSRTPVRQYLLPVAGAAVSFNLAVPLSALPQRASLLFQLSCDGTSTTATVTTNGAPLPGLFTVTPPRGEELTSTFVFAASLWTDPDLPLMYQFGFISSVSDSNLVIVGKSEVTFASTTLPAGGNGTTVCSLRTFDSFGAYTEVLARVIVAPSAGTTQRDLLLLGLIQADDGSVDSIKTTLAVATEVLNGVNCTGAPSCDGLHRSACRMTTGQCGPCLDGYVGDAGDRNTLCVLAEQADAHLIPKACSNNCTSHGACIYVSKVTGRVLSSCGLSEATCDAICACAHPYSGDFCELDPVMLMSRRELRSYLIQSLNNLTALEDVTTESVAAWAGNMYGLSLRAQEMSAVDVGVMADIANTILGQALALQLDSYVELQDVLRATDVIASLMRYNYNPVDYSTTEAADPRSFVNNTAAWFLPMVSLFGDLVARTLVVGENATSLLSENFRMSVQLSRLVSATPYRTPQTTQESQAGVPPSTVSLTATPSASADRLLAVKMVTAYPRSYAMDTTAYVSSPVLLQLTPQDNASIPAAVDLRDIEFAFQHNEPQPQYAQYEVKNFTSTCTERNDSQSFSFVCPDSGHVIRHNCSSGAGVHVGFCLKPSPACAKVAAATATISIPTRCYVLDSTATSTTCRCSISGPLERRRVLSSTAEEILDYSGATDMMASTVYTASAFADTFKAADAFNDSSAEAVLVVMLMLAALWVPGMLVVAMTFYPASAKKGETKSEPTSTAAATERALKYVDSVIPKVFGELVPWKRLLAELGEHHSVLQMLQSKSSKERRLVTGIMLTDLTFLFFLTAVFFDVSVPSDDGSCVRYTSQEDCLQRRSAFDSSRSYCSWGVGSGQTEDADECMYGGQSMTVRAMFYMTVLTTVLSSIFSIPVEYLFNTLSAPTANSLRGTKVSAAVTALVQGARRVTQTRFPTIRTTRIAVRPSVAADPKRRGSALQQLRARIGGDPTLSCRDISDELDEIGAAARESIQVVQANAEALSLQHESNRQSMQAKSRRASQRFGRASSTNMSIRLTKDSDGVRDAEATTPPDETPSGSGSANEDSGTSLLADIVRQRMLMNGHAEETRLFDAQWGLCALDQNQSDGGNGLLFFVTDAAASCITEAEESAGTEAEGVAKVLSNYSEQHAGLEILHLFMVDLLGRNTTAARVFKEKFGEEFEHARVVVEAQKYAAGALLIGLNAFFLYYMLLLGFQKGITWQYQFLACCLVQLAVELLLFETIECMWLNFMVPQYVRSEVTVAAMQLRALVEKVTRPPPDIESAEQVVASKFFLNAPAHLFVSIKLAKAHPQLLESLIVSSYTHHLPGQICITWPFYIQASAASAGEVDRRARFFPRYLLSGAALVLQLFLGSSYAYQKVVLRFVQPIAAAGAGLLVYKIASSLPALLAICVAGGIAVLYWIRSLIAADKARARVAHAQDEKGAEVPIFIDSSDDESDGSEDDQEHQDDAADDVAQKPEGKERLESDADNAASAAEDHGAEPLPDLLEDGMTVPVNDEVQASGEEEKDAADRPDQARQPAEIALVNHQADARAPPALETSKSREQVEVALETAVGLAQLPAMNGDRMHDSPKKPEPPAAVAAASTKAVTANGASPAGRAPRPGPQAAGRGGVVTATAGRQPQGRDASPRAAGGRGSNEVKRAGGGAGAGRGKAARAGVVSAK